MHRRRSLTVLVAAVAVTCGGAMATGQAAAKDKDALVVPSECYDLLAGGTARYLAPVDINKTTQNIKSGGDGGTGVFFEDHTHTVQVAYVHSGVGGVLDAKSSLSVSDCAGAEYALNVYDVSTKQLLTTVAGTQSGNDVRFLAGVVGQCVLAEMVSIRNGAVDDVSPDRNADGTPNPVKVCTPDGSGAGSFSG